MTNNSEYKQTGYRWRNAPGTKGYFASDAKTDVPRPLPDDFFVKAIRLAGDESKRKRVEYWKQVDRELASG